MTQGPLDSPVTHLAQVTDPEGTDAKWSRKGAAVRDIGGCGLAQLPPGP